MWVSVYLRMHVVCLHSLTTTLSSVSFNLFVTLLLLCPPFLNPGWDDRKEIIRMAIFITNSYHYPELYPEWNLLLVQFSSVTQLCSTCCNPMNCSTSGFPVHSRSLTKLVSIETMMISNHLILCHPLLPASIFSSIRVISNELVLPTR